MKPVIHEVIIVEGHHDTAHLKRYYEVDTIETGGSGIDQSVMDLIKETAKTRAVIVFTDPDTSGEQLREMINKAVPGCKNAFIEKKKARTAHKVGIEHASFEDLNEALKNAVTFDETKPANLTMSDLYDLGLCGKADSANRREELSAALHLNASTAKTLLNRLNMTGKTKEELERILHGQTDCQCIKNKRDSE